MKVKLINNDKKDFMDKYNGRPIVIPAGKAAIVEDYIAYHFIGNPEIINYNGEADDKILERDAERKRIWLRYGAFKPADRAKKVPKLVIEPFEEVDIKIVDAKTEKKEEAKDEFPGLKKKKGK